MGTSSESSTSARVNGAVVTEDAPSLVVVEPPACLQWPQRTLGSGEQEVERLDPGNQRWVVVVSPQVELWWSEVRAARIGRGSAGRVPRSPDGEPS